MVIPTIMPQNQMTKVAVYVRKRVTSLAIVLKKEKINPRGVASNVERKDILKPIVLMKPRIKGAVSRYLF